MREAIQRLLICWIIVAALSCPLRVWGATNRYMAPSGCSDSGACTSSSSPCCTFSYVFTKMSGGDTLYLADGTYTSQNYNNLINQFNLPPQRQSRGLYDHYGHKHPLPRQRPVQSTSIGYFSVGCRDKFGRLSNCRLSRYKR